MLAKMVEFVKALPNWVKINITTVLLTALVALSILLSFASGYIIAKYQDRAPIIINQSK